MSFKVVFGFRRSAAQFAAHVIGQWAFDGLTEQARTISKHFTVVRVAVRPDCRAALVVTSIQPQSEGAIIELLLRHATILAVRRNKGFKPDGLIAGVEIKIDFEIPSSGLQPRGKGVIVLKHLGRKNAEANGGQNQG